jgi:syntaxin 16
VNHAHPLVWYKQEIEQRGQEIEKIAKSIEELAQIFRELAVLVIDQGTILDRIDYNMENAVEHAKQGIEHLRKAEDSQKNALSVKCIIVLVILIAMMVGILIWKHSK